MSVIEKIKRDIKDLLHVQDKKDFLKKNINPYGKAAFAVSLISLI